MSRENGQPVRILVVCLGNICRSPAGEAALKEAAAAAGVDISVDSAGTGDWHIGQSPDAQIRAAGRRAGLVIDGSGRQITSSGELEDYDVILAMDRSNLAQLRRLAPHHAERMHLFRRFDAGAEDADMPDPYGLHDSVFDATVERARAGARAVVAAIQAGRLP